MYPTRSSRRPGRLPARVEGLEPRQLLTTIDVMVVYSNNALTAFGGDNASIQRAIRQSIDFANLAHQNTGDNVVLRLVHTANLNYSSTANQTTQLAALQSDATVATWRTQYGADLVSMVVDSPQLGGGLGNSLTNSTNDSNVAFSVVGYQGIGPGTYTLMHELAHNMGAGHERDNATQYAEGAFPAYSFGFHATGVHGTEYGDAMSYQGKRLPVFATPTYVHDGVAMGSAIGNGNAADLRSTFLVTAPNVAGYRSTVLANQVPTASLWQTDLAGDQLTFKVRYVDDVAISAATLGNGDVYVQTPEGYQLQAAFVGADVAGNGYARTATYRVTLPRNLPAVTSLGFYVAAGTVTDAVGLAVAAGQIATNLDGDLEFGLANLAIAGDLGPLTTGTIRRVTNSIGLKNDRQDVWRFTITDETPVNFRVSGVGGALTSDPILFVYRDGNLNEVDNDDEGELLGNSFEGGTADKTKVLVLEPGTYYAYLQLDPTHAATNYSLTLTTPPLPTPGDVTPPTAVLDQADATTNQDPVSFSVLYRDDNGLDPTSIASATTEIFFAGFMGSYLYDPVGTTVIDSKTVLATYQINFGGFVFPNNTTVTVKVASGSTAADGNGNAIVGGATIGTYQIAATVADTLDPSAFVFSAPTVLVPNGTAPATYTIVVAYKDNRGINTGLLGTGDIQVTGPGGFNQTATYVSSALLGSGAGIRLATYTITLPGGAWDHTDNGTYTVGVVSGQVKDTAARNVPAGAAGTFKVRIAPPGDADGNFAIGLNDLVSLSNNYGTTGGAGWVNGDFDFNGTVGLNDLVILSNNYGSSFPVVDEPATDVGAASAPPAPSLDSVEATSPASGGRELPKVVTEPAVVAVVQEPMNSWQTPVVVITRGRRAPAVSAAVVTKASGTVADKPTAVTAAGAAAPSAKPFVVLTPPASTNLKKDQPSKPSLFATEVRIAPAPAAPRSLKRAGR
ncbi:MAG: M12 family metallo-peptidase [Phycisphaerae bacterium]|nr:M12 family metallo-peptidase [Tepidisphaeraceae bacterium]